MTRPKSANQLDLADCPCAGGTLDRLIQPAILIALAEEPMHGYRLAERIGEFGMFHDTRPDASGVYRFLNTMENRGLVVATWDTSAHGPAKKSYRLTADGERCLKNWIQTLQDYRCGISALLKVARKAANP
jgi:DNA-binding PadR family transcriptional regulator